LQAVLHQAVLHQEGFLKPVADVFNANFRLGTLITVAA
jgi:hypothetical protein